MSNKEHVFDVETKTFPTMANTPGQAKTAQLIAADLYNNLNLLLEEEVDISITFSKDIFGPVLDIEFTEGDGGYIYDFRVSFDAFLRYAFDRDTFYATLVESVLDARTYEAKMGVDNV